MATDGQSFASEAEALLTAREFARRCGVSVDTVRRWARTAVGPRPIRIGPRALRYRPDEVRKWIAGGAA